MIQKSLPPSIYHPSSDGCNSQLNKYEIKEKNDCEMLKTSPLISHNQQLNQQLF
jgi:hypothetical protein